MKQLMIACSIILALQATTASAGAGAAGTPGQQCNPALTNSLPGGCPADCDRAYSQCRAAYPFPADAVASRLFRQIDTSGNGNIGFQELANWSMRRDHAKGFASGRYTSLPDNRAETISNQIAIFDLNYPGLGREAGDGQIAYREAMRYGAFFYNETAADDFGGFHFPPIQYPSSKTYADPRNDLSAPYHRRDAVSPTYAQYKRRHPEISIPTPRQMGGSNLDDSYVSPYGPNPITDNENHPLDVGRDLN